MRKGLLFLLISCITILGGCGTNKPEEVVIEDYDLTNLTTCIDALSDFDEETDCLEEDKNQYILDYATHYIQYMEEIPEVTAGLTVMLGSMFFTISYDGLPSEYGFENIALLNQIVKKIYVDMETINEEVGVGDINPGVVFNGVVVETDETTHREFIYIINGSSETLTAYFRFFKDSSLIDDFSLSLDLLEEVNGCEYFHRTGVNHINNTESVYVRLDIDNQTYSIGVLANTPDDTTDLTSDDFTDEFENRFSTYTVVE